jgi:hypothetical protein
MGFDPSQPMDLFKAQRHLDTRGTDATGTREYLTDLVRTIPKKPFKPNRIDPVDPVQIDLDVPLDLPPTPRALPKAETEHSDYAKLGIVNTLLTMGAGPAQFAAAPTMAAARKAANNKPTSTLLSRLLRGYTQSEISD